MLSLLAGIALLPLNSSSTFAASSSAIHRLAAPDPRVAAQTEKTPAWSLLQDRAKRDEASARTEGWAYLLSGGAALAISIPGYFLSQDLFAKAVFSVAENLAVASVAYGSYSLWVADERTRFARVLEAAPDLSARQRETLSRRYLDELGSRARTMRRIRLAAHGLTAALNYLNGATTRHAELRATLLFLGAMNTLAVAGLAFGETEEESDARRLSLSPALGGAALTLRI